MTTPAPEYCSIETVAARLDCSESTVRAKVAKGKLPQPYKGVLVRWRWDEVAAAIEGRKLEVTSGSVSTGDPILDRAING